VKRLVEGGICRKKEFWCVLAVLLTMAALGGYFALGRGDDGLGRIQSAGVIRIGYAVEPPYAMHGVAGEVTGEAPEIARHIVEKLGIARIEWRQVQFSDLIRELKMGFIDVAAAGMFITPEREGDVFFSIPTMEVAPAILVAAGHLGDIVSYEDLVHREGLRAAVVAGSVEEYGLQGLDSHLRILRVPDALTGFKAVETGLAEVFLLSEPSLRWMLVDRGMQGFEVISLQVAANGVGQVGLPAFAFGLDNVELRDAWNDALLPFLGSREHCELVSRFGLKCRIDPSARTDS
jgi:polar amino acid transport system substrate-binding protein